jgi:signal transduction histidine kinase
MDECKGSMRVRVLIKTIGVPLALCLLLFAANSFVLRHFVTHSGELILDSFKRQNIRELTSGDVLSVSGRIYSSLEASDWGCLKITRDSKVMIDETRGFDSCRPGILDSLLEINMADRGGIVIAVLFTPPHSYIRSLWLITLLEFLIIAGYTLAISRLQRQTLSQRFELESAKLREQAALARTTQILAHDVRKPLQIVKMITEVIKSASADEAKELLQSGSQEIEHALVSVNGMIEDVLLFENSNSLKIDNTILKDFFDPIVRMLAKNHQVPLDRIAMDSSLSRHAVAVDQRRFARVVSNILDNALYAIGTTGVVWIKSTETDGYMLVALGNSDSSIPADRLDLIFDEFYTSEKKNGTGLGLAIAKRIVEAHGGTISCTSTVNAAYPKGMVEFVIKLPLA